jgi:tetratricopeptide (TPR) repeat protein
LRLDPHNVLAFANRGSAYRKKKRYGAALGDFHAAIQLDPDDPRLHYQRGLTYRLKDEPERAAADFDAAARLDPSDPEVFYQRGLTNDSLGRKAAAKADLSRAIELAPDHAAAFNARGTLNFVLGDNKAAEADLCEALRLDPDFALAYLNRASVRSKVGFFKEAVADSDEAIRRDPGLTTAYLIRGSAYAQTEQFDSAIADFTEVLRRQADNDQAFYLRGVALSKTGDFAGAQADLTEALRLDPSNARAYAFRGLSHQALRRAEPAVRDFAHAVRLDGRYAAAYCNQRAALHSARGEYEQAVADYSLVLLLDPDNGDAKAARDQALRALLTRPAEKPEPAGPAVEIALEPPPAKPAAPEKSRPAAQTEARVARQDRPKTRPDAPKTGTMPKAPATRSQPAVAPPTPAAEAPDDSAEFSLGPANETPEEDLSLESPEDSARVKETPGAETSPDNESVLALDDADGSNDLLLSEPDSEAERSRQERFEEQHQKELARAEESARLQRLAVERQRMLEEVKRKKSDIDRARRAAKRPRARDNDGEGIAWDQWFQWGVRAALAAMVLWGCFWIYDLFLGNTISTPTCYPLRGSVKFADGRPVPGVLLLINGEEEREADIRPDGTFQTRTYSNTGYDGVPLGEYKVFVAPPQQAKDAIPPKYLKGGQTPWVVRVKRQDNSVDFVVQPDGSAAN